MTMSQKTRYLRVKIHHNIVANTVPGDSGRDLRLLLKQLKSNTKTLRHKDTKEPGWLKYFKTFVSYTVCSFR